MKYTVVSTSGGNPNKALQELNVEVNQMIDKGWKPLGGISFTMWGLMINSYHQAMIFQPAADSSAQPK